MGTAVLLQRPLDYRGLILVVSITTHRTGVGLRATPSALLAAMENVFATVTDHGRIDSVRMPLLGAGHGGLRAERSLLTLAISWAEFLTRCENQRGCSLRVRGEKLGVAKHQPSPPESHSERP